MSAQTSTEYKLFLTKSGPGIIDKALKYTVEHRPYSLIGLVPINQHDNLCYHFFCPFLVSVSIFLLQQPFFTCNDRDKRQPL